VKTGTYDETVDHYNLLATLEQMYGLTAVGNSASATAITDIWN
jgi:acid phosphatase